MRIPKVFLGLMFQLPWALAGAAEEEIDWEQDLNRRVDQAIDRAIDFLETRIRAEGWHKDPTYPMGRIAIQVYALLKSDIPHVEPVVREGLERLEKLPFAKTYSASLYALALDAALAQQDIERAFGETSAGTGAFLGRLREGTTFLLKHRFPDRGAWGYPDPSNPEWWDNSNTQFAVLALAAAARRNVPVPGDIWRAIADHFIATQEKDGPAVEALPTFDEGMAEEIYAPGYPTPRARGWSYRPLPGLGSTMEMTCAGISSLLLARRHLASGSGGSREKLQGLDRAVRDGVAWITRKAGVYHAFYYHYGLYSVEKVGDIAGIRRFGEYEWYAVEADRLLAMQRPDGGWGPDGSLDQARYETSFALLFLNRATDIVSTQRPMVVTGRSDSKEDADWVYLRRLDARISARKFFRRLRFRAGRTELALATAVVENYDPERVGELVPTVAELRRSLDPRVRAFGGKTIERITGLPPDAAKDALDGWLEKWEEVVRIGKEQDREGLEFLLGALRDGEGVPLKERILWALIRIGARDAVGVLIHEMGGEDADYRKRVFETLSYLSGKSFPFSPSGSRVLREKQIKTWRSWWQDQGSRPTE